MTDTPPVEVHVDDPNKTVEPPKVEVHNHPVEVVDNPATPNVDEAEVARLRQENEELRNNRDEFRTSILEEVQRKIQEGISASREVVGEVVSDAVNSVPQVEVSGGNEDPNQPPVQVELEEEPPPAKREHWLYRTRG